MAYKRSLVRSYLNSLGLNSQLALGHPLFLLHMLALRSKPLIASTPKSVYTNLKNEGIGTCHPKEVMPWLYSLDWT